MNKINNIKSTLILNKYKKLIDIKKILKKEFIGLDNIIDELIDLIEPWYLFPEGQIRPTIINLFGMTGTGKTSLINRLFQLLKIDNIMKFDTGEWVEHTEYQLSSIISSQLKKIKNSKENSIFVFDEFQLGKSLDEAGNEIDRPNLRVIWNLLDTGKFTINDEKWQTSNIQMIYNKLYYLINEKNLKAKNGKITKGLKEWHLYFDFNEKDLEDDELKDLKKNYTISPLIPPNALYTLLDFSNFLSERELGKFLLTKNETEILNFVEEILVNSTKPVEYDFSNSLIFIIGNLDSAYSMAYNLNADSDPDTLHEHSKKITVSDIKDALSDLYRMEQISRLGNNYLIYRSFSKQNYIDFINLELNKFSNKIIDKFGIKIEFSEEMKKLIFKEGVYASQGVRPIFSTITSLIESKIGKILIDIIKNNLNPTIIFWHVDKNYENVIIKINDKTYKYDLKLKVENHRKSKNDDIQALIGVHEAGHIVTSVYTLNICPKIAVSKTIDRGGFTHIDFPSYGTQDFLEKKIITLLSGYVAEKMIFGEKNLSSGSISDLEESTQIAISMFKKFGMKKIPILYKKPDFRINDFFIDDKNIDLEIENYINDLLIKTENILTENKNLLLQLGKYLSNHSKIEENKIKSLVKKYGVSIPIYKTGKNYYNFKELLNKQLKK